MPDMEREIAPAKLNLRLKLLGRRADGYHLLSMLNVATSLHDVISFEPREGEKIDLRISGSLPRADLQILGDVEKNSAVRALRAVSRKLEARLGLKCLGGIIAIEKHIPLGSGLGGGSSDAAALLRIIGRRYALEAEEQKEIALSIGADVPFFLSPGFAAVRGIGEQLEQLRCGALEGLAAIIIKPPVAVSTAEVFERARREFVVREEQSDSDLERFVRSLQESRGTDVEQAVFQLVRNDLTAIVLRHWPAVEEALRELDFPEILASSMTGSGSAVFGLFREQHRASVERRTADWRRLGYWVSVVDIA